MVSRAVTPDIPRRADFQVFAVRSDEQNAKANQSMHKFTKSVLALMFIWAIILIGSEINSTRDLSEAALGAAAETGRDRKLTKRRRKVYFAGSIRGGRQDVALYRQLIDHIGETHGEVLTEHVGKASLQSMGEMGTTDNFIYERDMAWLRTAHVVVAEVTRASLGVG